jgi:hypothetical protein
MGRARKRAIDPVAALYARATDDPMLAAILDALVDRLQLWQLCAGNACLRARGCRGDAVACGARRWPHARAFLRQGMKAPPAPPTAPPPSRPLPRRRTKAGARKVTIDWRDKSDAKT